MLTYRRVSTRAIRHVGRVTLGAGIATDTAERVVYSASPRLLAAVERTLADGSTPTVAVPSSAVTTLEPEPWSEAELRLAWGDR